MATFPTTPATALAIAARLVKANIPFTLTVHSQTRADIECKFEETLGCVVMQHAKELNISSTVTGRISGPVNASEPGKRIPVAFSDPVHQERYDRGVCVQCNNVPGPCSLCGGTV